MDHNDEFKSGTHAARDAIESRLAKLEGRRANARWWKYATLMTIAATVFAPLAADALGPVPNVFSAGDTISASEMNANFTHLQNGITANEGQVPSGTIIFYNGSTCPTGWSEVTAARGRTIVGLTGSAGTLGGTVGTPLVDMGNRSHNHSVNIGSFDSGSDGSHNHRWIENGQTTYSSSGAEVPLGPQSFDTAPGDFMPDVDFGTTSHDIYTNNAGGHTHSVNPPATNTNNAFTADVIPYVQYLVCQRD